MAEAAHMYGTVAGVQAYVLALVFTETTKPSTVDVENMLVEQSAIMDMRLAGAGYAVPVAAAAPVALLASVAVRFVAAGVIERLSLAKSPDAAKAESAATWRREAEAAMEGITSGRMPLAGATMSGRSATTGGAGIATGSETAFPHSNRDAFIRAHGAETANPNGTGTSCTRLTDDADR